MALKEFSEDLRSGKPIEVTEVRRVETPDGPMHIRTKKILGEDAEQENTCCDS